MPAKCTACHHEQRADIDRRLAATSPPNFALVGRLFGLNEEVIARHYRRHLPELLVKATNLEQAVSAEGLVRILMGGLVELKGVIERSKAKGDERAIVAAVKAQSTVVTCLRETAVVLDDLRNRPIEIPPDRAADLAVIESLMARKVENEVAARLAASPASPANPRSTQRSAVRPPGVEALPDESPTDLAEAAGQ